MKILVLSFLWFISSSYYVINEKEAIQWEKNRKLSWNDFKGDLDLNSEYMAKTFSAVKIENINIDDAFIHQKISTTFYPNLSWTKNSNSKGLLNHEQLHFDITELIARKIRKYYSKHISKDMNESIKELDRIYNNFYDKELDSINFQYDSITNHGINDKEQKEWEEKIAKELKSLEQFTSTKVIIKREVRKSK